MAKYLLEMIGSINGCSTSKDNGQQRKLEALQIAVYF
jgi:hypothetical protein